MEEAFAAVVVPHAQLGFPGPHGVTLSVASYVDNLFAVSTTLARAMCAPRRAQRVALPSWSRLLDRVVLPGLDYRCTRWPVIQHRLDDVRRAQRTMTAIVMRIATHSGIFFLRVHFSKYRFLRAQDLPGISKKSKVGT